VGFPGIILNSDLWVSSRKCKSRDFLTVGQYLAPSSAHLPVAEYVHPTIFHDYERAAYDLGFKHVASGPFVRSSYNAEKLQDLMQAKTPGDSQES